MRANEEEEGKKYRKVCAFYTFLYLHYILMPNNAFLLLWATAEFVRDTFRVE